MYVAMSPDRWRYRQLLYECGIGTTSSGIGSDVTTSSSASSDVASVVSAHRVLIFCQLKGMLDIVEHQLLK